MLTGDYTVQNTIRSKQGRIKGGGGAAGLQPLQNTETWKLEHTDFGDIMVWKVLRDFPLSWNQPLKSTDDWYIRILKNKLIQLKKRR
jgi:hypothetical protein